jgi:hypothetical protein
MVVSTAVSSTNAENQRPGSRRIAALRKEILYPAALGSRMKRSVDGG